MASRDQDSTAQREGVVDQQDAVIEEMKADTPAVDTSARPQSTAEREGIVDQQDAVLEAMEDEKPEG